jgi:hypothetical protein
VLARLPTRLLEVLAPQRTRPRRRKPVDWRRYATQVRRAERTLKRPRHPFLLTIAGTIVLALMGSAFAQAIGVGLGKGLQDLGGTLVQSIPQSQDSDLVLGETEVIVSTAPILDTLPEFVKTNEMLFEGRVPSFALKPDSSISLSVNGKLLTTLAIRPDGRFGGIPIALQDGTNVVEAKLVEGTREIAATSHTVIVDRTAPELKIVRPAKGDTVEGDEVIVEGSTEPGADVTVNDRALRPNPDGSFTERLIAAPGSFALTVVAKDRAGNETKTQLTVTVTEKVTTTTGLALAVALDRVLVKPGESVVAEIHALQDGRLLADLPVTLQVGVVTVGTYRTDANGMVRVGFKAPNHEVEDLSVVVLGGGTTARASLTVAKPATPAPTKRP